MTVENVPWMVEGALHSAASGRRALFQATNGSEGVSAATDLRVKQTPIAGGSVLVSTGSGVMLNRYPSQIGESYQGAVTADHEVAITPNGGGSTRYDLVIMRVDDWNFPGAQAQPSGLPRGDIAITKLAVITGVAAETKTATELVLGYPAIALARIAVPAGTAAVTDAMITDLRKVARPRRLPMYFNVQPVSTQDLATSSETAFIAWPAAASQTIDVPSWATKAIVKAHIYGAMVPVGQAQGYLRVRLGNQYGPGIFFDYDVASGEAASRPPFGAGAVLDIPPALRGTQQVVETQGSRRNTSTSTVKSTAQTLIMLEVEFIEEAGA